MAASLRPPTNRRDRVGRNGRSDNIGRSGRIAVAVVAAVAVVTLPWRARAISRGIRAARAHIRGGCRPRAARGGIRGSRGERRGRFGRRHCRCCSHSRNRGLILRRGAGTGESAAASPAARINRRILASLSYLPAPQGRRKPDTGDHASPTLNRPLRDVHPAYRKRGLNPLSLLHSMRGARSLRRSRRTGRRANGPDRPRRAAKRGSATRPPPRARPRRAPRRKRSAAPRPPRADRPDRTARNPNLAMMVPDRLPRLVIAAPERGQQEMEIGAAAVDDDEAEIAGEAQPACFPPRQSAPRLRRDSLGYRLARLLDMIIFERASTEVERRLRHRLLGIMDILGADMGERGHGGVSLDVRFLF